MIGHWAKRFTQSTILQPTIFFGESNGSAALATTRVFQATPQSTFAWRSFPPVKRIRCARDRAPLKQRGL
jgi:hypothetical protein